jgi:hypothetical protein
VPCASFGPGWWAGWPGGGGGGGLGGRGAARPPPAAASERAWHRRSPARAGDTATRAQPPQNKHVRRRPRALLMEAWAGLARGRRLRWPRDPKKRAADRKRRRPRSRALARADTPHTAGTPAVWERRDARAGPLACVWAAVGGKKEEEAHLGCPGLREEQSSGDSSRREQRSLALALAFGQTKFFSVPGRQNPPCHTEPLARSHAHTGDSAFSPSHHLERVTCTRAQHSKNPLALARRRPPRFSSLVRLATPSLPEP